MKNLCLVILMTVAVWELAAAREKFTTKYDNIDLDEILKNERLYKKYFHCLTGEGKCTPDGQELKDLIPEALRTDCSECSDKQKAGVKKVLEYLIKRKPADWDRLAKIYDPQGKHKAALKDV